MLITHRRVITGFAALFAVGAIGLVYATSTVSLSALDNPGQIETFVATRAKRWLIARAAKDGVGQAAPHERSREVIGEMQFRASCAGCHGLDGREPTELGRGLYPRASDLGAPEIQHWSDQELFWIVKHGIRLTGMPGFGHVHADERIWDLVAYLRRIGREQSASGAVVTASPKH